VLRSNKETGSWEACCPATARARYSLTVLRLTPSSRAIARALALPRNGVAATPVHVVKRHPELTPWRHEELTPR
jgi:hypothetical protein